MIEVERLAKSFAPGSGRKRARVPAVVDVSFRAPDGAITALLGPNGAGKTTTLRVLATLMQPEAGSARVGGVDVTQDPQAARATTGVLSDARGLYTRLTARENIGYYARLRGVPPTLAAKRIEELAGVRRGAAGQLHRRRSRLCRLRTGAACASGIDACEHRQPLLPPSFESPASPVPRA